VIGFFSILEGEEEPTHIGTTETTMGQLLTSAAEGKPIEIVSTGDAGNTIGLLVVEQAELEHAPGADGVAADQPIDAGEVTGA